MSIVSARREEAASSVPLAAGVAPLLAVLAPESVPLAPGGITRPVYLDYAATAPALPAVAERVTGLLPMLSSVHRGAGWGSHVTTTAYEDARAAVARSLGARRDDSVVFTRHTTDALNLLATAVPGETVVLDLEHHANLLPWLRRGARVVVSPRTRDGLVAAVDAELSRRPAALLAVTAVTNVTGELLPLRRLAEVAHANGARIAVDAAQLIPHRRLAIERDGVDFAAFSGHKAYAPFGAGVLVGRADWLDAAPPYLDGGGATTRVRLGAGGIEWKSGPARHEAGTPNVLGAVAIAEALRELDALPPGARETHDAALGAALHDELAHVPGLRTWSAFDDAAERLGVAAFTLEGFGSGRLAAILGAEHGIAVRSGRFCAHPLTDRVSDRPLVRASTGVGSTRADIEALAEALRRIAAVGPRLEYARQASGEWQPVVDHRR